MIRSSNTTWAAIAAAAVVVVPAATRAQDGLVVGLNDETVPVKVYQGGVWNDLFDPTGGVFGLAADGAAETIYFNDASTLYSWSAGGGESLVGTITDATGASLTMHGLSFNPSDGFLYATTLSAPEGVYRIDPSTAMATIVNDYDDGDLGVSGFTYDAITGDIWGASDTGALAPGIYDLSGAPGFLTAYPAGETDIDGLAAYNGIIYLTDDDPGNFYSIDSNNVAGGYTAFAGPWSISGAQAGAAIAPWLIIPAPGPAAVLSVSGLALIRRRRR